MFGRYNDKYVHIRRVMLAVCALMAAVTVGVLFNKIQAKAAMGFVIVYTAESTDVKAQPDESSKTITTVGKNTSFFVSANAGNGWYKASYQGAPCYLKAKSLKVLKADFNSDPKAILGAGYQDEVYSVVDEEEEVAVEAPGEESEKSAEEVIESIDSTEFTFNEDLQKELEKEFEEASRDVENTERLSGISKKSRIWRIVIAIIVIAMFAVGVVSVIIRKKSEVEGNADDSDDNAAGKGRSEDYVYDMSADDADTDAAKTEGDAETDVVEAKDDAEGSDGSDTSVDESDEDNGSVAANETDDKIDSDNVGVANGETDASVDSSNDGANKSVIDTELEILDIDSDESLNRKK